MKIRLNSLLFLFGTCIILFAFTLIRATGIKGTVAPAESAGTIYAISGTDSLKAEASQGAFEFSDVKAGTYKVVVEAKAPYKNFEKEGVEVKEGEVTDLGTITLAQ
jgi:hypothetical protein